jgi:DNA-binding transcriptional ArsR family regulator
MKSILEDEQLQRAAETLRVVSHPARLRIVEILVDGERSVTAIQESLGITQSQTSQHLSNMRVRGVLKCRKDGNMVYYSIANPDVVKVIHCIRQGSPAGVSM